MGDAALVETFRTLGLRIVPGLLDLEPEVKESLIEAGRRHARVDLDRLDTAIAHLIDVRYDDEPTRKKARKALADILAIPDPEDAEVAESEEFEFEGTVHDFDDDSVTFDVPEVGLATYAHDDVVSFDALDEANPTGINQYTKGRGPSLSTRASAGLDDMGNDVPDNQAQFRAQYKKGRKGRVKTKRPPQMSRAAMDRAAGVDALGNKVRKPEKVKYNKYADPLSDHYREAESLLLSEATENGAVWDVLLIAPGMSKNRRNYPAEVLKEATPLFDGARAFATDGPDHDPGKRGVRSIVGWYSDPQYRSGIQTPKGVLEGVTAKFHVSEAAGWLRTMLLDSWNRGKPDLVGFSIVGDGKVKVLREASGRTYANVERIESIESVDPVVNPAAGGMTLRLVASKEGAVDWSKMTLREAVKGLVSGTILPDELKDNRPDLFESLDSGETPEKATVSVTEAVTEALGRFKTAQAVEAKMAQRKNLPEQVKTRIREATADKVLNDEAIEEAIKAEVEYVAAFAPAVVRESGSTIADVKDEKDQFTEAIYDVLAEKSNESFRDLYVTLTGDRNFSGHLTESGRLTESITSSTFAEIMGDSITRRMLDFYNLPGLDSWRNIATTTPVRDFRTQRRIRFGGYGNLPAVSQGDPYVALSTPGDEEATYAPTKRGGTEDMTLEAVANDDLNALRDIPRRLGRAAAQTLHEFVWDFVATNANIYDGVALFHANHGGNLGSTALDTAPLAAGRLVMKKQTDMTNGKRLGLAPRFLVVPSDLEQKAYELTATDREVASANNTLNFIRTFGLTVIVVDYWTDANNWFLVAGKADVPTLEIGFLNGQEQPELFLQDQPTVGNVFSNDKLTYKIRHIYGGAVLDYRGFYGAIVA